MRFRRSAPAAGVQAVCDDLAQHIPASGDLGDFLARLTDVRGRPVQLITLPIGVAGLWVRKETLDQIVVAKGSSWQRTVSTVGHEVGHMLLGHMPEVRSQVDTLRSRLDDLSMDAGRLLRRMGLDGEVLGRSHFDSMQEREAEEVGTWITHQMLTRAMQAQRRDWITEALSF